MQREGYELTAEFEADHWWYRSRRELFLLQVKKSAEELASERPALRLLDFGCGTGFNLAYLSEFGEVHGGDIRNKDLDEFQIQQGFPMLDLEGDNSKYAGYFDVLTALDVLEHIEDDVEGLSKIAEFVAPGGQIILTVPAYRWLWGGEDVLSDHKRRYTRKQLVELCRNAGCQVLFASYFNLSILPAMAGVIWTRKLFGRGGASKSNVQRTSGWLNSLLHNITGFEARLVGRQILHLPAGASLVCRLRVAERKASNES